MSGFRIGKFSKGDILQVHHILFMTDVLGAETMPSGKAALSSKRHFGINQELTAAGAQTINNAVNGFVNRSSSNKRPGSCPDSNCPNYCIDGAEDDGTPYHICR